jgi:diacylglycerol kinase family enzyme
MAALGVLSNPRSRRNLRSPETLARLRAIAGSDAEVAEAATPEALAEAVERFRTRRVDLLAVNGGDGTTHLAVTALARAWGGEPLPMLALLRGGAMNTVAHAHGIRGTPEALLRALVERRRSGAPLRTVDRDLLAVSADGTPERLGFLFGTGAVVRFLEAYYRSARPGPATAAALLVRAVVSALLGGRLAAALIERAPLRIVADAEEWPDERYAAVLAGSVPELGFGSKPFARCAEQPGFFHAVGVTAPLLPLALCLPRLRAGRPWRRRHALDEVARQLVLTSHRPRYTVDGELYQAEERVTVSTGPGVEVVVP